MFPEDITTGLYNGIVDLKFIKNKF